MIHSLKATQKLELVGIHTKQGIPVDKLSFEDESAAGVQIFEYRLPNSQSFFKAKIQGGGFEVKQHPARNMPGPQLFTGSRRNYSDAWNYVTKLFQNWANILQAELVADEKWEALKSVPNIIPHPDLPVSTGAVQQAIDDVEASIRSGNPVSGVDRIHTALHGYVIDLCGNAEIELSKDESLPSVLKKLFQDHPSLRDDTARKSDVLKILRAFANVVDSFGTIRNRASLAHANDDLLGEPEAMLVINSARTILHYLNDRLPAETGQA